MATHDHTQRHKISGLSQKLYADKTPELSKS